jgi:hypothetical protein
MEGSVVETIHEFRERISTRNFLVSSVSEQRNPFAGADTRHDLPF